MNKGIYLILIDKYFYIGRSSRLDYRFRRHKNDLEGNRHCNLFLQRVYNKHKDFLIVLLERCKSEELINKEQFYIDFYKAKYTDRVVNSGDAKDGANYGVNHHQYGKPRSKETKDKISRALKGVNNHPNYVITEEHKKAMRKPKCNTKVYTFEKQGETITCTVPKMARVLNIDPSNLNKLVRGKAKTVKGWRNV